MIHVLFGEFVRKYSEPVCVLGERGTEEGDRFDNSLFSPGTRESVARAALRRDPSALHRRSTVFPLKHTARGYPVSRWTYRGIPSLMDRAEEKADPKTSVDRR